MEDANLYAQRLKQANHNKFYYHFLYKALIVSTFLIILALFPSQAPEFINQTLNTRGWEFLHLVFVGIAVSYGLFSRRNDEAEKENKINNNYYHKFDNAQSYLSRLLQVSSIFGEESDSSTGASPSSSDGDKFQTWSNQYYRNDPMVVVAEESPVLDKEEIGASSVSSEKPLLLPVRRLKSHSLGGDASEIVKEASTFIRSNSYNSGSKRYSGKEQGEKLKDQVAVPSPSPWRSIPGRIDVGEDPEASPPAYTQPPKAEEFEYIRPSRSQARKSASQPNSTCSSPKISASPCPSVSSPRKFASSASFSLENQGKSAEDFVRKKSLHRPPPPPPPPPPPHLLRNAVSKKQRYRGAEEDDGHPVYPEKDRKTSLTNEARDLNRPRSVRTIRSTDWLAGQRKQRDMDEVMRTGEEAAMDRTGSFSYKPQPGYNDFPDEVAESEAELETEEEAEDDNGERGCAPVAPAGPGNEEGGTGEYSDEGPDVDKKADEFIARFREQIRLQRIESIKRSSGQVARSTTHTTR